MYGFFDYIIVSFYMFWLVVWSWQPWWLLIFTVPLFLGLLSVGFNKFADFVVNFKEKHRV